MDWERRRPRQTEIIDYVFHPETVSIQTHSAPHDLFNQSHHLCSSCCRFGIFGGNNSAASSRNRHSRGATLFRSSAEPRRQSQPVVIAKDSRAPLVVHQVPPSLFDPKVAIRRQSIEDSQRPRNNTMSPSVIRKISAKYRNKDKLVTLHLPSSQRSSYDPQQSPTTPASPDSYKLTHSTSH